MQITVLIIGKTDFTWASQAVEMYQKRVEGYINFKIKYIPDIKNTKNMNIDVQKRKEGELILSCISSKDEMILLDEKGKEFSSKKFAEILEQKMLHSSKSLVFVMGGAYGFSEAVYQRANSLLSLSQMTFSHQIVRIIFLEQLYRAFSIIKGEPYHHE